MQHAASGARTNLMAALVQAGAGVAAGYGIAVSWGPGWCLNVAYANPNDPRAEQARACVVQF